MILRRTNGTLRGEPRHERDAAEEVGLLERDKPVRERGDISRSIDARDASLRQSSTASITNTLFPPLPDYGPPSRLRSLQYFVLRSTSYILSTLFLLAIFIGTILSGLPFVLSTTGQRARLHDPARSQPFYDEEKQRQSERKAAERQWAAGRRVDELLRQENFPQHDQYIATEGGADPLLNNIGYYARRVGLNAETFEVQTDDGFVLELVHVFNPREHKGLSVAKRGLHGADHLQQEDFAGSVDCTQAFPDSETRYPVLMIHGLLQSSGAFCCNDDDSLAFYLAKSGYDVWLGNNRCGFEPKHTVLKYEDPRMWAWNIRQMGVLDLPALIDRVLGETGFSKLALIAHSQGTTETFVALAKEQRPDIGNKISVFCALAPAVYAGPLISKTYFRVMQGVSPAGFRLIFGIHAFIPIMMLAHKLLPAKPYSWLGYRVFSHLFNWSDNRWDRGLRDRMFQCAPVYVSAESMRWWLGRDGFAKQRCILSTREENQHEDQEDEEDDEIIRRAYIDREPHITPRRKLQRNVSSFHCPTVTHHHHDSKRGRFAWYDDRFPPLAMWIAGADDLVDGRRLLRRFDRGREPHVRVVHKKIIEGYEHLDVIWAMDAIEKVGKEIREVIWRTVDHDTALRCRVPFGCEKPLDEDVDNLKDVPMMHSGGRLRMASFSENPVDATADRSQRRSTLSEGRTRLDATVEDEGEHDHMIEEMKFDRRLSDAVFSDVREKADPLV